METLNKMIIITCFVSTIAFVALITWSVAVMVDSVQEYRVVTISQ